MSVPDLNRVIAGIVAEEVAASLAPYLSILDRLAKLSRAPQGRSQSVGASTRTRGVERAKPEADLAVAAPVVAPPAPARKPRPSNRVKPVRPAIEIPYSAGQIVMYRRGNEMHEARVLGVDGTRGVVALERLKNGKQLVVPVARVSAHNEAQGSAASVQVNPAAPVLVVRRKAAAEERPGPAAPKVEEPPTTSLERVAAWLKGTD